MFLSVQHNRTVVMWLIFEPKQGLILDAD
uniref:Uncharacterized protein n=1 Tax=Arundo donax TaxID=35708 RepID=A0A0A9FHG3_ARUDO